MGDFVLLCEFCEQEGPVPLLVVPPDSQGMFKLNDFVLKAMAVDYQVRRGDVFVFTCLFWGGLIGFLFTT